MPKILYIDSSVGIFGGGQISLLEFLTNIDRAKYDPLVIVGEEGKLKNEIEKLGIECCILRMLSLKKINPFPYFAGLWRIFNYVRKMRIKLIHSNTSRATLYAGPVAKILRVPLVWHVRIPHPDKLLDRFLVPFCSRIIAVSRTVKKRFNGFKKAKVEVVYNGVDTEKFSPGSVPDEARKRFHINREDVVVGTIGRISPEKGFEYLITAIRDVVVEYPQVKVLIVGNGNEEYRRYLQGKINEAELSSNIMFTGFYGNISLILRCLDIYCLPSLSEGFNRSILEAMSCQLPVIASNVGGNIEVVQDGVNGLLVPPGNSERLAAAIIKLLKDREKAQNLGLEGRQFIKKNFSTEKNVEGIEKLYLQIIK